MTDEQQMLAYVTGDEAALTWLFKKYHPIVKGYILKRLRTESLTDEVVQEIFLKLHKSRSLYKPEHKFKAWLFTISQSVLMDHYRKQKRQVRSQAFENLDTYVDPESLLKNTDQKQVSLSKLSLVEKQALELRYYQDMEFKDIAEIINKSESNVRKIISRALQLLKSQKGDV